MINDDRADFARLMGASSYLATAPRVKDWNEFKNTILKFERGELQGSSPGKPTPEMEAHMKGFVEHLKKQNEEKREQAATEAKQRSRSGCLTSQSLLVVILLSVLSVSMLSCESETDRQDRL